MRRINFSSGDNTPSNDVVRLNIAMEADSQSSIYLQYSGGKTLLSYATNSAYVFNVERFGRFSGEYNTIDPSYSNNIGYESGICWVPGKRIASSYENFMIFGSNLVKSGRKFHASLTYTSAVNYHIHKKLISLSSQM